MVMQQIANLSSRLGCIGSSPILSATKNRFRKKVVFYFTAIRFYLTFFNWLVLYKEVILNQLKDLR